MAEIKDKIVTVESLGALRDYNIGLLNDSITNLYNYNESTYIKGINKDITIPITGWELDSATNYYKLNVINENVTAESSVYINLNISSIIIAEDCGLKGVTESYNGGFYIYADFVPETVLVGTLLIQFGGAN